MEDVYSSDHDNASVEKLLPNNNPGDFEQNLKETQHSAKGGKTRWYLKKMKDIIIYALAIWGFFNIISQVIYNIPSAIRYEHNNQHVHDKEQENWTQPKSSETRQPCTCGNSIAESISLGCVFDSLSPAWIQPHCQDTELSAEFETLGDGPDGKWIYYADRNHTQEISRDELMAMGDDPEARFHVTWEWHVVHCWMYWIKQYRAPLTGIVVEKRYDHEGHIRHCAAVFQNPVYGTMSSVVLNADWLNDD